MDSRITGDENSLRLPAGAGVDVIALLQQQAPRAIDNQLASVDSLNARAGQVVAASTVILSVVAAIDPTDESRAVKLILGAATVSFVVAALLGVLAWRVQRWRDDPRISQRSLEKLASMSHRRVLAQLLVNRKQSYEVNLKVIAAKRVDLGMHEEQQSRARHDPSVRPVERADDQKDEPRGEDVLEVRPDPDLQNWVGLSEDWANRKRDDAG